MQKNYEEEFKKKIIRLHIEEGRTIKSLSLEYSISKSAVSYWLKKLNLNVTEENVLLAILIYGNIIMRRILDIHV